MLNIPVILVGAGAIGALWDTPDEVHCFTHAHAVLQHPSLTLHALIEPAPFTRQTALTRWGKHPEDGFASSEALFESPLGATFFQHPTPWLVIASPDETHVPLLNLWLPRLPSGSVCIVEKPLGFSVRELEDALLLAKRRGVTLWVNYSRYFYPNHLTFIQQHRASLGALLAWHVTYQRGFWHNASHGLHLLQLWHPHMSTQCHSLGYAQVPDAHWDRLHPTDPTCTGAWLMKDTATSFQCQLLGLPSVFHGTSHDTLQVNLSDPSPEVTYVRTTFEVRGYFDHGMVSYSPEVLRLSTVSSQGLAHRMPPEVPNQVVFCKNQEARVFQMEATQALPMLYQCAFSEVLGSSGHTAHLESLLNTAQLATRMTHTMSGISSG
ncbi:MAG: Gfo/Idh/MocA family oxidoreductase [Vampirovibrionales bacterium]